MKITDEEMKFELAKAALMGGMSTEQMRRAYEWIKEKNDPQKDLDKVSISDMEEGLGMLAVRFRNRCMESDIKTVGELVRLGKTGFRAQKQVGGGLVASVETLLQEKYGVDSW